MPRQMYATYNTMSSCPTVPKKLQLRRDTAADWTAANPILAEGEVGIETDTYALKIGDGVTRWNLLGYFTGGGT